MVLLGVVGVLFVGNIFPIVGCKVKDCIRKKRDTKREKQRAL